MNRLIRCLLAATLVAWLKSVAAAGGLPLELATTIELPGVKGRIDHFAVDVAGHRVFVAALGNDTVEVLDTLHNRHAQSVRGFGEPQGVAYLARENHVYVANGSSNRVDILDGRSLAVLHSIARLEDADNVRYDAQAGTVLVGYGKGALRVIDAPTDEPRGDIALSGHPESFQLEANGGRAFVNVPTAGHVAVVDRAQQRVVATWPVPARANFPMALDERGRRLFVGARSPALMLVYDIDNGTIVARVPIGGDTDDLFYDGERKLVYVVCGEGRVDVFRQESADAYTLTGSIKTAPRARTGLFVPEEAKLYVAAPANSGSPARVLVYAASERSGPGSPR